MSGGSKAKTSSNTDQSVTTIDQSNAAAQLLTTVSGDRNRIESTDNSNNDGVVLSGSRVSGSTFNLTETDHGAVAGSLDFARDIGGEAFGFGESAFLFANEAGERAASQTSAAMKSTSAAIDKVGELAQTFKDGAGSKTLLWIVGGVGAVTVITVLAVTLGGKD
jgi:hypothetical protein